MSDSVLVISGPAAAETVRILRTVSAAAGARAGLPVEQIDELRIAVDEAATLVLRAGPAEVIELRLELGVDRLRARISTDRDGAGWPEDRASSWPWRVITKLAVEAELVADGGHPEVRFVMRPREDA
jgi:serine/threonine-protein kinase RsbW